MTPTNYVAINIVLSLATNMPCLPLSAESNFQKTEKEAVVEVTTDDFSIIEDPAMGAVTCLEIISMQLVHTGDLRSLCALSAAAEPVWNQSWSQQNGVWVISQQQVASKNSSSIMSRACGAFLPVCWAWTLTFTSPSPESQRTMDGKLEK